MTDEAERLIQNTWVIAVTCSFLIHLLGYGAYQTTKHLHWGGQRRILAMFMPRRSDALPSFLNRLKPSANRPALARWLKPAPDRSLPAPVSPPEQPLQLTLVDPSQATEQPPEHPKYYAARNSLAGNPEIRKPSDDPDIKGSQTKVPDTLNNPKPTIPPSPPPPIPDPTPPTPPSPPPAPAQSQPGQDRETLSPSPKPKGGDVPGDLAMARPSDTRRESDGAADSEREQVAKRQAGPERESASVSTGSPGKTRPRTLVEARLNTERLHSPVPSRAMEQVGGHPRLQAVSSLDAKGTPLGAYDEVVVAVVRQRWYDLLDNYRYAGERKGRVVLDFQLHSNGRISDVKMAECTVGELLGALCQLAITDPAPYPKWPPELARLVGREYRDVRFTFFYE